MFSRQGNRAAFGNGLHDLLYKEHVASPSSQEATRPLRTQEHRADIEAGGSSPGVCRHHGPLSPVLLDELPMIFECERGPERSA